MSRDARANPVEPQASPPGKKRRRGRWWKLPLTLLAVLVVSLAIARPFMPRVVRWYVNRTLDRSPIYQGKIGDIDLHLWRGAYSIHDVRIIKMTGDVPVPLFSAKRVDFAIEWNNLMHRKIVAQFVVDHAELNFVAAANDGQSQSGAGGPWLQIIQDLFPFKINSARIRDSSIHFRTYQVSPPVDVYMADLNASLENLTNIRDETTPLLASVDAKAMAMNQAPFELHLKFDPFSYYPSFNLTARLIGLDVTKINDLALAYGNFDFKHGFFDLVVETTSRQGLMSGYVKPLFRDLTIFRLPEDLRQDDPIQFFWTALVGGVTELLTNQPRDQFGTLIPFTADVTGGTRPDLLAAVGNILRNAFVRAYLPNLDPRGQAVANDMHFSPPEISSPITAGAADGP